MPTAFDVGTSERLRVLNSLRFARFVLLSVYLRNSCILITLSLAPFMVASGQSFPVNPAAKLLPEKLADFRAAGSIESIKKELSDDEFDGKQFGIISRASRNYVSRDGRRFSAHLVTTSSDSGAYSLLTDTRKTVQRSSGGVVTSHADVGTADFWYWDGLHNQLSFFKGKVFAAVEDDEKSPDLTGLTQFGRSLADTLDRGEGDIPVLVKHLPDWQSAQHRALYAVTRDALKSVFGNEPVLDAVGFEAGTEVVIADYSGPWLAIVEFNTPQLATDNHGRITAKLQELRNQGQPVPTAYRRVGNYSVFVFDAPSQEAANSLIDKVKYEQMVQWLGKNPYLYERALREFSQTTLGVFVNVVKGSGLALVSCLAIGGLLGGFLFVRRRGQQRAVEAYSDAGGLLRLNLDEMTPEIEPGRLLGPGK